MNDVAATPTQDWDKVLAQPLAQPCYEIRFGDVWKTGANGTHVCDATGLIAIAFFRDPDGGIVAHGSDAAVSRKVAEMMARLDPDEHQVETIAMPVHPKTVLALNLAVKYGWTREHMLACLDRLRSDPTIALPRHVPR